VPKRRGLFLPSRELAVQEMVFLPGVDLGVYPETARSERADLFDYGGERLSRSGEDDELSRFVGGLTSVSALQKNDELAIIHCTETFKPCDTFKPCAN